jgi:hypothetical protein
VSGPRGGRFGGESIAVGIAVAIIFLVLLWRITLGASLGDDAHVLALALRMAQGDRPFIDEMNLQALGSVWGVPLTWLWTHLVGLNGLVLVSRLGYLAFALGAGAAAYRALRVSFRPVVAATAVALPLLAPPYNLLDLGYNTAPIALGILGLCAAHAALTIPGTPAGRRWALAAGAATASAVFSNPLTFAAGVVLLAGTALLARRRAVILPLTVGAAAVTGFALVFFASVGFGAIRRTLDYTSAYRESDQTNVERFAAQFAPYRFYVWRPRFLPAAALALLSAAPRLPPRVRAVCLVGAAIAVVVPSFFAFGAVGALGRVNTRPAMGTLPAVTLVLLVVVLALPVTAWAVRRRRRDIGMLLAIGLPAGLVGVFTVTVGTLSSSPWGAALVGGAPAVTALAAGWAVMAIGAWRGLGRAACAALVAATLGLLVLTPFRDGFPWQLDARVASGPYAGVLTSPATQRQLLGVEQAAARWLRPGDGVLFYALPGGYLLLDAPMDTNLLWLGSYGAANQATLDWFARTGRRPRVVVIAWAIAGRPGGLARIARRDPLMAYLLQNYRVVEAATGGPTVLVRK